MRHALLFLIAAVVAAGCSSSSDPAAQGQIRMNLVDAPGAFDAVNIVVTRVDVHRAGADSASGWIVVRQDSAQYDLLELRNGVSAVLGNASLDAGQYTQIRLLLGAGSHVMIGGVRYELVISSGYETGVKLNHPFTISSSATTELTLDFDAEASVRLQGLIYRLTPVIRVVANASSGSISGKVLPLTAMADVWTVAGSDTVRTSADATTGDFKLMALPEGSYSVYVHPTAGAYPDSVVTGVSVSSGQNTNIGTIHFDS